MYIERIELQNIKSYGSTPTIVEFGKGINLIAGENGAGKSTILEAIGFALFDALPYSQSDFVKRGKSGKSRVVVRIRSSFDDRQYDIERTVNPSSFGIYDVNENFKESLESKGEALEWIKQHLKVEKTSDLTSLFDNAVGMQQGTITTVFLERASKRKDTFDALLRVEDYDNAWEILRETDNYIKDLITENQTALAVTENTIETFKDKPNEAKTVRDEIEDDSQELDTISADITRLDTELYKMDELSQKAQEKIRVHESLEKARSNHEKQVTRINQLLPQVEERSQLADEVKKIEAKRALLSEEMRALEEKHEELASKVQDAQTVFDKVDQEWNKYQEATKECERLRGELDESIELQLQIEDDLARREKLEELLAEAEETLNQAIQQKSKAEALLKSNSDAQLELQQMRELLGEEGAKCPVCRQEMHGKAHTEAIQFYEDEEQKIAQQNIEAQSQLESAKTTIKQEKKSKNTYQDELNSLSNAKALTTVQEQINGYKQQIKECESTLEQLTSVEESLQDAQNVLASSKQVLEKHDDDAKLLSAERTVLADEISKLNGDIAELPSQKTFEDAQQQLDDIVTSITQLENTLASLDNLPDYDEEAHNNIKATHKSAIQTESSLKTKIESNEEKLLSLEKDIVKLQEAEEKQDMLQDQAKILEKRQGIFSFVRQTIRDAGPRIRERKVRRVSEVASNYFRQIIEDYTMQLKWDADDYAIIIEQNGEERPFQVLSGGEQMIAALSVRLALLTHLTRIRVIFLDEPTINLDENRRVELAQQLRNIDGIDQLFVITHDDTFEAQSDHRIRVTKQDHISTVEVG